MGKGEERSGARAEGQQGRSMRGILGAASKGGLGSDPEETIPCTSMRAETIDGSQSHCDQLTTKDTK